jgi:hypothetical protein
LILPNILGFFDQKQNMAAFRGTIIHYQNYRFLQTIIQNYRRIFGQIFDNFCLLHFPHRELKI